ncbi:MAG: WS/DGAT/MGAT family O-acyltransferase [Acidimicrobiia bacterium]
MALPHYERLSHLDASFLALESRETHMHVAGVGVFEAGPLEGPDGGIDIDAVRAHVESKLPYIPRYRQRLAFVPLERSPVWVDEEHFNLDYHVRHTSLPRPGNEAQLKRLAARICSQQLDRAKPLWELWVVEGLESDRFALIGKIHHSMIDGISGVDLLAILLNVAPTGEREDAPEWRPRPVPTGSQLLISEAAKATRRGIDTLTHAGDLLQDGRSVIGDLVRKLEAARQSLSSGWLTPASKTPLNRPIGPNRRFEWTELSLADVKSVRANLGGSINDVVLGTVAGALRHFFLEHRGFPVDHLEYRVMAPVSVRTADQRGALGNQVAMWLVQMPLAEPDPTARLRAVQEITRSLRRTDQALGASTLVQLSAGAPTTLVSLGARLAADAYRPFNMTVTNVPGPQFPMYLLGSRMLAQYPIVPLWAQHGLGIALFSYDGRLLWGLQADWDAVPDFPDFIESIHRSFRELQQAAGAG